MHCGCFSQYLYTVIYSVIKIHFCFLFLIFLAGGIIVLKIRIWKSGEGANKSNPNLSLPAQPQQKGPPKERVPVPLK